MHTTLSVEESTPRIKKNMNLSLVLTNCQIVSSTGVSAGTIAVSGERIHAILPPSEVPPAETVVDGEGNYVFPGLIDTHVHFRTPGAEYKEDWKTGSRAAAAGGVTTVVDMPNTNPPTTTAVRLEEKRTLVHKESIVDYGFFLGVDPKDPSLPSPLPPSIAGVKVYLDVTTGGMVISDPDALASIFSAPARFALHAEGQSCALALSLLSRTSNPTHVCHVSKKEEVELIQTYKRQGMRLSAETTPHHLFLTRTDADTLKGYGIMKPPLAEPRDQRALWDAIRNGAIDSIATDHAPHTRSEKESPAPPYGVPGLETTLPLLITAALKGDLEFKHIALLAAERPAHIFGIRNKGSIAPGNDADFVIVDMRQRRRVRGERLHTKCGWSPFEGWELYGWPLATFVRGRMVYKHGDICAPEGWGKEISYKPSTQTHQE